MSGLSVTLQQKSTSILVGGMFLLVALIIGTFACFNREVMGITVAVMLAIGAVYFFFRAGDQQTLDAEGIHIKTYLRERHYPWKIVEKTRIIKTSFKDLPHIQFFIRGKKRPVWVYYTKRTLECVIYYYGELNEDCLKQPPANV